MPFNLRGLASAAAICAALAFPNSASAQETAASIEKNRQSRQTWAIELDRFASATAGVGSAGEAFPQSRPRQGRRGLGPAGTGALIGSIAALGVTYAAASTYGNNEGGRFCTRCFVQWSAFAVPVGAAAGAAIGWGIGRSRPSVAAAPVFSRKGTGVVLAVSF